MLSFSYLGQNHAVCVTTESCHMLLSLSVSPAGIYEGGEGKKKERINEKKKKYE